VKKIKKQAILLTLTLILILFACNAVSAADNSNNTTQSNNSSTQLSAANPTAVTTHGTSSKVVISGKVLKCSDGTSFSGVTVTASKGGSKLASTTTGSDGTYTLNFLSSDDVFNVTASYPGHVSSIKNVAVAFGAGGTSYGAANFKLGMNDVYVSTTGNDADGRGSSSKPVQTIKYALDLVNDGGTIHLMSGTYDGSGNYHIYITKNVTIKGNTGNANDVTIIPWGHWLFEVHGVSLTLQDLTIKQAADMGAIISYGGSLSISNCRFINNTNNKQYGVISTFGTCTVTGCTFIDNTVSGNGGVIYNTGTCTVTGCTFTGNNATGAGGAIYNKDGTISSSGCTFTGNNATTGGAIYNKDGTCTIYDCTFKNNRVNTTITGGDGAAIYNSGTLNATISTFEDNTAESGAIWNEGTSTITYCTFTNNNATNIGGAIENYGAMNINFGTFEGNKANSAGAISNYGSLAISNSTFTRNTATNIGGAISQRDDGHTGSNNALTITGSTFTNNTATTKGSAIYCGDNAGTCNIHFNTIYGNTGTNDIYSKSTIINAVNNWWGTNFSGTNPVNANMVNGNVNADPWIVLTLTSSDNLVDIGRTTTVKANLKYNSAGTDVSSLGTVPDEDVVFTFDSLGSVSPTSGTISKNLNATTTFTAGSTAGNSVVSAAVNGQTVTTTIKIRDLSNVYVNPNTGNDSTGDGSHSSPLQSLAKAISEVRAGGTVHVAKGTYSGANNRGIRIDKDVTIIGESQNNTIIDAQGQNSTFFVGYDFTVTIKNLMFSNGNATSSGNGGAIVSSGTLNLNNCTFINNTAEIHGGAIYTDHPLNINGCTFTGNTAKYGGAIRGISYVPYTFTVHFSSFVNNTATTGNAIYCDNYGSVNATLNWWGSNNPAFSSLVGENVDYSPWMVLNITSNTATVKKGGSAAITVNMLYDSDGNYHNPASGHVPDGADVIFTGTRGSLNPTGSTLIDGQATSIFTANAAGAAVVFAAVDDETVQTPITIAKVNTNLVVGNAAGVNGKTVNLTATLTDEKGNPVDGEIVNFNVNGNTQSAKTNASGVATWSYLITETAGIYTVTANFAGDDNYILSSGTGTLTVNIKDTTLVVGNVTGVNGKTANLTATLKDVDGNPLSGKIVNFHVNGKDYTVTTDLSGVATWSYPISETAGVYIISASFVDGKIYANSSGTGTLTVNTINTTLIVNNATGYNGKTANLTATLKDVDGNPLRGKTVNFNVNGNAYTATTDASGLAALSYKLTKAGVYNIIASFSDGAVYANSTGSGNLTVSPAANLYIKITASNNNPEVGEKFLLTYKLGNYGPDAAENVTITFKLPEGLDFVKVTADTGNCTYDPATRTVTWTIDSVPVGDPYLYFAVKAAGDGTYKITPDIDSSTYNSGSSDGITINVQSLPSNDNPNISGNSGSSTVKAASTISMQKTGVPLNYLILAIFLVLSGLVPKRK
jgi:predicted outer membrane repeat protein